MRRLACGRSKLYELIGRGLLTRVHVSGRAARITAASVDAYIARLIEEAQQ